MVCFLRPLSNVCWLGVGGVWVGWPFGGKGLAWDCFPLGAVVRPDTVGMLILKVGCCGGD